MKFPAVVVIKTRMIVTWKYGELHDVISKSPACTALYVFNLNLLQRGKPSYQLKYIVNVKQMKTQTVCDRDKVCPA